MDVISLSKANKAKKKMKELQVRLGEGEYKHGELDIKGTYENTEKRLSALEEARVGLLDKKNELILEESIKNEVEKEYEFVLDDNAIEFGSIEVLVKIQAEDDIYEDVTNQVGLQVKTNGDYQNVNEQFVPEATFSLTPILKIKPNGYNVHAIKFHYKAAPLLNRLSELEMNTHINLNKHNLRVNALLDKKRYNLKEMVVDDFGDATGIDSTMSSNIKHDVDNHKVTLSSEGQIGEMVTVKDTLDYIPSFITLSAVTASDTRVIKSITNEFISIPKKTETLYEKSFTWESKVIDLGEEVTIRSLDIVSNIPEGTAIVFYAATSKDGYSFTEYKEVSEDGVFDAIEGRYIKVKAELTAKKEVTEYVDVYDLSSSEQFEENEFIIVDGAAKLKTAYKIPMTVDTTYTEEGILLKTAFNKNKYKTIVKVEVK